MDYAPVVVFVYDRIEHFSKCIEAIKANKEAKDTILYVVSDAPSWLEHEDKVNRVREYSRSIMGFREVRFIFREENFGAFLSLQKGKDYVVFESAYMMDGIVGFYAAEELIDAVSNSAEEGKEVVLLGRVGLFNDGKPLFNIYGLFHDPDTDDSSSMIADIETMFGDIE